MKTRNDDGEHRNIAFSTWKNAAAIERKMLQYTTL